MDIKNAIQTLADWAICSATTQYSCESCSRYDANEEDTCHNAVTEEQIEEAIETLIGRD